MDLKELLTKQGDDKTCPVAIIIREGKILTGLRHYTPDKYKKVSVWTVPGGRCDHGETLEETLRREVSEEVGITDLTIYEYGGEVPGAKEGDNVHLFVCESSQDAVLKEPEKFSEWRWLQPNDIPENFINAYALEIIRALVEREP